VHVPPALLHPLHNLPSHPRTTKSTTTCQRHPERDGVQPDERVYHGRVVGRGSRKGRWGEVRRVVLGGRRGLGGRVGWEWSVLCVHVPFFHLSRCDFDFSILFVYIPYDPLA
jgi:hypothetical protein